MKLKRISITFISSIILAFFISISLSTAFNNNINTNNDRIRDDLEWSTPPINGDTLSVDPNNRLFYLHTDRYRSFAFPLAYNSPDAQIPYLDNAGLLIEMAYNFSTPTKSEAAGVYICLTENAMISQSFWQMPGLFDQNCHVSRFFVSDSDPQEQTHRFNHEYLPSGPAFGVMIVRFSNLTMFDFLSRDNTHLSVLSTIESFESNPFSTSDGNAATTPYKVGQLRSLLDIYQQIQDQIADHNDNQPVLANLVEQLESTYFIAPLQSSDHLGIYLRDTTSSGQPTLIYPPSTKITQQDKHLNHINSLPLSSTLPPSPMEYHSKLSTQINMGNQDNKFREIQAQAELQFSLTLYGNRCIDTFGAYCSVTPLPLFPPPSQKSTKTKPQNGIPHIHLEDLDADETFTLEGGDSILFYHNPSISQFELSIHRIEAVFESTEPLNGFASHSFVPVITNASAVSEYHVKNDSTAIYTPDRLPGVYYEITVGQEYPLMRLKPQELESPLNNADPPLFSTTTWWLVLTNPYQRPAIVKKLSTSIQICTTIPPQDTIMSLKYIQNDGDGDNEKEEEEEEDTKDIPYCEFTPLSHDFDGQLRKISPPSSTTTPLSPPKLRTITLPSYFIPKIPQSSPLHISSPRSLSFSQQQSITSSQPQPSIFFPNQFTNTMLQANTEYSVRFRFQPYSHQTQLSQLWTLAFAVTSNDKSDSTPFISFVLYLRRNQYPIPPTMTEHGSFDSLISNDDMASHYTQYFSLPAFADFDPVNVSNLHGTGTSSSPNSIKNTTEKQNFQVLNLDDVLQIKDNFDSNEDIWYGHIVITQSDNVDLYMWYKEACPNQCGNLPSASPQYQPTTSSPTTNIDTMFNSINSHFDAFDASFNSLSIDGSDFHGQCVTKLTQIQPFVYYNSCECDSDWMGLDCTVTNTRPAPSNDFIAKWLGIIIVSALILLLIIFLIIYKFRQCLIKTCCPCCCKGDNRRSYTEIQNERTKLIKGGHYPSHSHLSAPHQLSDDTNNLYANGNGTGMGMGGYYDHNGNFVIFQQQQQQSPNIGETQSHRSLSPYVLNNKVLTPNHPGIFHQSGGQSGSFHITGGGNNVNFQQQISPSPIFSSANSHDVVTLDGETSTHGDGAGQNNNKLIRISLPQQQQQIPGPSTVITPRVGNNVESFGGQPSFTEPNQFNQLTTLSPQQYQQIIYQQQIQLQQQQIQLLQQHRGQHGGMIGGVGYVIPGGGQTNNNPLSTHNQQQSQLNSSYSPSIISRSSQFTTSTQNGSGSNITTTTRAGKGKIKTNVSKNQPHLSSSIGALALQAQGTTRSSGPNTPVISSNQSNQSMAFQTSNTTSQPSSVAILAGNTNRETINENNRQSIGHNNVGGNIGEYYNISFDLSSQPTNLAKQNTAPPRSSLSPQNNSHSQQQQDSKQQQDKSERPAQTLFGLLTSTLSPQSNPSQSQNSISDTVGELQMNSNTELDLCDDSVFDADDGHTYDSNQPRHIM